MGIGFASWRIFLHILVVMYAHGSGAREISKEQTDNNHENKVTMYHDPNGNDLMGNSIKDLDPKGNNVLRLHSDDRDDDQTTHTEHDHGNNVLRLHSDDRDDDPTVLHKEHDHGVSSSHSHMDHMDPSLIVFFMLEDLKLGNEMPIYFPKRDVSSSPHLLPREQADSIPFSSKELPNLLQLFSFSRGSPQAKAMEDTIRECEIKPIIGETKICATSLESMRDFAHGTFGLDSQMTILSTTHLTKSKTLLQNYTILKFPQEISAQKIVACHTMPYPYAIFYCHSQESESKVFKVSLGGENGDRVEALAVCHMDTSKWSKNHVSFRVLGIQPGTFPVCHFFPDDNLVWIPISS